MQTTMNMHLNTSLDVKIGFLFSEFKLFATIKISESIEGRSKIQQIGRYS